MMSPCARALLAVMLVLGQLAGLWHGLEHIAHDLSDDVVVAGDVFRHADGTSTDAGFKGSEEKSGESGEHAGAPCGACLLASAGTGLVGTASAVPLERPLRALVCPVASPGAPPAHPVYSQRARGPPVSLS